VSVLQGKVRRVVLVRQKSKTIRDAALTPPCKSAVIDGEVVARKEDGTPDFSALNSGNYTQEVLCVWAFDLMELNGEDLWSFPLVARKRKLAMILRRHDHLYVRHSEPFKNGSARGCGWTRTIPFGSKIRTPMRPAPLPNLMSAGTREGGEHWRFSVRAGPMSSCADRVLTRGKSGRRISA